MSNAFHFSEYLATFKKTVAMHEVFLQRLAAHPVLRTDVNFRVFLEYDQDVSKNNNDVGFIESAAIARDGKHFAPRWLQNLANASHCKCDQGANDL
jgi:hypothetical protein